MKTPVQYKRARDGFNGGLDGRICTAFEGEFKDLLDASERTFNAQKYSQRWCGSRRELKGAVEFRESKKTLRLIAQLATKYRTK